MQVPCLFYEGTPVPSPVLDLRHPCKLFVRLSIEMFSYVKNTNMLTELSSLFKSLRFRWMGAILEAAKIDRGRKMSHSDDEKVKARRAVLAKVGLAVGALYAAPAMVGLATAQAGSRSRPSRKSRPSRYDRYHTRDGRGYRSSRPSRPSRYSRYSRYSRVSRPWFYIRF